MQEQYENADRDQSIKTYKNQKIILIGQLQHSGTNFLCVVITK